MVTKTHQGPVLIGTNAERTAYSTGGLLAGTIWVETDTGTVFLWNESAWWAAIANVSVETPRLYLAENGAGTTYNVWLQERPASGARRIMMYGPVQSSSFGFIVAPTDITEQNISFNLWASDLDNAGSPANGNFAAFGVRGATEGGLLRISTRKVGLSTGAEIELNIGTTNALKLDTDRRLNTTSGRINNTTRVTTTYTVLITDEVVYCDTDGGAFTATLPAGVEGQHFKLINVGSSGNNLTVDGDGAETVRGAATLAVTDGNIADLHYNATEGWW